MKEITTYLGPSKWVASSQTGLNPNKTTFNTDRYGLKFRQWLRACGDTQTSSFPQFVQDGECATFGSSSAINTITSCVQSDGFLVRCHLPRTCCHFTFYPLNNPVISIFFVTPLYYSLSRLRDNPLIILFNPEIPQKF